MYMLGTNNLMTSSLITSPVPSPMKCPEIMFQFDFRMNSKFEISCVKNVSDLCRD